MFAPGPRTTSTFKAIHSYAIASPNLWIRSTSQVEAIQAAVGKQVAGRLFSTNVVIFSARRTPCGPSVTIISGMPRRLTGVVVHGPAPVQRAAFSSNVIFLINSVIFVMVQSFLVIPSICGKYDLKSVPTGKFLPIFKFESQEPQSHINRNHIWNEYAVLSAHGLMSNRLALGRKPGPLPLLAD